MDCERELGAHGRGPAAVQQHGRRIAQPEFGLAQAALDQFDAEGLSPFRERYTAFDALAGRVVSMHLDHQTVTGTADGLAEDGALRVRIDGQERLFHAGEVSVRPQ
ncbi:MAG: hypothetical protein EOO78_31250 [Oxalobacteraceae bacterium]|nr:MAG: hypothetical protein EOO78_31250 [Oxalobacteraceae bacterium]